MKLAFLGSPDFAVPVLQALVDDGHEICQVVSRANRRRRRGGSPEPSPVRQAGIDLGLPVSSRIADVVDSRADLAVVVAFGRLISAEVLAQVPMVNLHCSLLPRWRGAAPIERAILAGDTQTGVCLMRVAEGLDTGPIYGSAATPLDDSDTTESLRVRLAVLGTDLLLDLLRTPLSDPTPQVGEPVYAEKIAPAERHLDWTASAVELRRVVRIGGAWTTFRQRRFQVLEVAQLPDEPEDKLAPGTLRMHDRQLVVSTADGSLILARVQPEGRKAQPASEWANGARLAKSEVFV